MQRGGITGNFSKIQELPQTSTKLMKIVENLSSHQNNYFRSIETCFKKIWSNAKGDHSYPRLSKVGTTGNFSKIQKLPQASPNFLKIVESLSSHQNNYFRSIKTCFKICCNAKGGTLSTLGLAKGGPQDILKFKRCTKLLQTF
jgi:Tfp pilus assembly protein PilE